MLALASRGATVHRIMADQIRAMEIPVPPLPEQQRIVGVLDEAFASLATAQAHAAQNLQNARALFESHLNAIFTQRGKGWVEKTMEEVAASDCSLSYGIVQPGEEVEDGLPVVRPTDLTRTKIGLDGLKRIDPKLAESYQRTSLQGGELLLCVRGSTGVISMAAPELKGANVTRGIVPIRLNSMLLSQDFGFHLLRAEPVQTQIRAKTYGAALMQINIGDLRKIVVAVPALNEQRAIATQLDALAAETQRLTRIYEQKLAALAELKKSLLHQAFSGEL
jgi:type I restriction enzyme S subunit